MTKVGATLELAFMSDPELSGNMTPERHGIEY